ncbi:uncharacterized protein METZ01_LOCUS514287, partial [marine metagenome]
MFRANGPYLTIKQFDKLRTTIGGTLPMLSSNGMTQHRSIMLRLHNQTSEGN